MGRWPGIGREEPAHEGECLPVLAGVRCRDAIARHHELEVAHVRVAGREQHALGSGQSGHDQSPDAEMVEEHAQARLVEAGVLGFEHEIVVGFRRSN